jgi:Haem-binding domain
MAIFAAIQVVPVERKNFPGQDVVAAPPAVQAALRDACYDCHSNQTRWPWYSAVAPASWLAAHEVNEGRRRLNFSNWDDYASDPGTESQKLAEIAKFVAGGDMAPWYYRALHPRARLSVHQRELVVSWTRERARRITP